MNPVGKCPYCGTELTTELQRCPMCGAENLLYGIDDGLFETIKANDGRSHTFRKPEKEGDLLQPIRSFLARVEAAVIARIRDPEYLSRSFLARVEAAVPGLCRTLLLFACAGVLFLLSRHLHFPGPLPEVIVTILGDFLFLSAIGSALSCLGKTIRRLREKRKAAWRAEDDVTEYWAQIVESVPVGDEDIPAYRVRYCVGGSYFSTTARNPAFRNAAGRWIRAYHHRGSGKWDPDTKAVYLKPEEVITVVPAEEKSFAAGQDSKQPSPAPASSEKPSDNPTAAEKADVPSGPAEHRAAVGEASLPQNAAAEKTHAATTEHSGKADDADDEETISYEEFLELESRGQPKFIVTTSSVVIVAFYLFVVSHLGLDVSEPGSVGVISWFFYLVVPVPVGILVLGELLDNIRRKRLYSGPVRKVRATLTKASSSSSIGNTQKITLTCSRGDQIYRKRYWGGDVNWLRKNVGKKMTVYLSKENPRLYDIAEDSLFR